MAIYPIPELELDRKLELAPDRKLDNCSHPIPELELDRPFIKELELELDNYSRSFRLCINVMVPSESRMGRT